MQKTGNVRLDSLKIRAGFAKTSQFTKKLLGITPVAPYEVPKIAFYRSLVLPGWGQATNKQYWKMGIVYAAAAGGIYGVSWNNQGYQRTRGYLEKLIKLGAGEVILPSGSSLTGTQLFLSRTDNQAVYAPDTQGGYWLITKETLPYATSDAAFFASEVPNLNLADLRGPFVRQNLEPAVNTFRRQRDLSIIGFTVGWLLLALEANVAGHLKTFNMSEDLSWRLEPNIERTFQGAFTSGIGFSIQLP
ncbi:MAG: DUF5683 domain-containing protein [Spirosomataceae bacterium]